MLYYSLFSSPTKYTHTQKTKEKIKYNKKMYATTAKMEANIKGRARGANYLEQNDIIYQLSFLP